MTIIEAIRSGRNFHRKREEGIDIWICNYDLKTIYTMSFLEMIADDWEIEEEKIGLTRTQIVKAIAKISKEKSMDLKMILTPCGAKDMESSYGIDFIREHNSDFLKELGFKE